MSQSLAGHSGFDFETEFKRAENLWRRAEYASALQAFFSILLYRLKAIEYGQPLVDQFDAADVIVIERLVDASVLLNHLDAADSLLSALVNLTREAGNSYAADYYLLKRAHLALERGRLLPVRAFLAEMHPTIGDIERIEFTTDGLRQWESNIQWNGSSQDDRKVLLSRLYLIMGRVQSANGQYRAALVALERGLLYTETSAPKLAQATRSHLIIAIVTAHLEKGEFSEARERLSGLQNIDGRLDPGVFVTAVQLSAKLDLLRGDFGKVTVKLKQIRDVCARMGLINGLLAAELNRARHLMLLNQIPTALAALDQLENVATSLGDMEVVDEITRLKDLGNLRLKSAAREISIAPSVTEIKKLLRQESAPQREESKPKVAAYLKPGGSWLALFEDYSLSFQRDLSQDPKRKDFSAAAARLKTIKEIFDPTDSQLIRVRVSYLEALLAYYQGRVTEAEEKLSAIQPEMVRLELIPELWQLQRVMGWCWIRLDAGVAARSALARETQRLLVYITNTLAPEDRTSFLLNKWTADEEFIANQADQLVDMKMTLFGKSRLFRFRQRWSMMKELNKLVNHIDAYKATRAKSVIEGDSEIVPSGFVSLWRRLFKQPLRRATISYVVLMDRLLIIQSKWMSLDFGVSGVSRIQLRQMVCSWHHNIEMVGARVRQTRKLGGQSEEEYETMAKTLAKLAEQLAPTLQIPTLVNILRRRIKGLAIIPDDILNGLPFAAISYTDKHSKDKYLVERYSISIGFDTSLHTITRERTGNATALLVGVSVGARFTDGRIVMPLDGVRKEIEEVAKLTPQLTGNDTIVTLTNGAADRNAVLSQLAGAQLAHIACHGIFKIDRPDESGMVLIPDENEIQILSLRDLHQTVLKDLRHITLASCWSADNFSLPGRWVISLPETMWRSGAQSVLGSLWAVDDQLSVEFMKRFYGLLRKLPRDQALRRTQLDCIKGRLSNLPKHTANPVMWSCFTLYGTPERLRLN